MKRKRKMSSIKNKDKGGVKVRSPIAPPKIRHEAKKGTGYNRRDNKKEFRDELRQSPY